MLLIPFLKRQSIRRKIILLLLIPLLALGYLSTVTLIHRNKALHEAQSLISLGHFAVAAGSLIHELQSERGMSAGFISSQGKRFTTELPQQRLKSDLRFTQLQQLLTDPQHTALAQQMEPALTPLLAQIDKRQSLRQQIDQLTLPVTESSAFYTGTIGQLLTLLIDKGSRSSHGDYNRQASSYGLFLQLKERAGQERALFTTLLATHQRTAAQFEYAIRLDQDQIVLTAQFLLLAAPEIAQRYQQLQTQPAWSAAEQIRQQVLHQTEGWSNTEPTDWFARQSAKINLLKELEDQQAEQLLAEVTQERQSAVTDLISMGVLLAVAVAIVLLFAVVIIRTITHSLVQSYSFLNHIAEGDGDLTRRFTIEGTDELAQLGIAFNRFADKIETIIFSIQATATALTRSVDEVSSGNSDLSSRTEEQASSLEETASRMEQLTAIVRQNAAHSNQADQMARSASRLAQEGGGVVEETITAMGQIQESSQQIADIITTIDEIAFQTNLLALNAAVEAARAGEQGRSFAVVATEVRQLAQRSATAAKEIKQLIQTSLTRVERGSALVNRSGQALNEIVREVKKMSHIMSEIASANHEQAQGLEQVNTAVSQMDHSVQQNAALVEQLSSVGQSMKGSFEQLVRQVSLFKVRDARLP